MHSSAVAAFVAAVTGLSQAPERRPPEFPADVRLIRLDVSVVDGRGRPAAGLSPSDFEVKEDGRPVAVTYFEAIRAEEASGPEIGEPGSVTPPPRRILLLVDTGRMSRGQLRRARKSVAEYIGQARDGEWLRLANLSSGEVWDGEMPSQRAWLLAAARTLHDRPSPWTRRPANDEAPIQERHESPPERGLPSQSETTGRFLSTFAQSAGLLGEMEALITELGGVPGRKAVVLVSPGFPQMRGLDDRLEHVATLARQASTAVYYVDSVGMDGLIPEPGERLKPAFETAWLRSGGAQDLAHATGGFTMRFYNSLLPGLARVSAEMRTYYVLGYVPPRADGRFRSVSVKVKVPGLSARTKKGYLASR